MPDGDRQAVHKQLNQFADFVVAGLAKHGLPQHASPLWRPWSVLVVRDREKVLCAFSPLTGGIANVNWLDKPGEMWSPDGMAQAVRSELGREVSTVVVLPPSGISGEASFLEAVAGQHVDDVERANRLGRLGDLSGVRHLEPQLRQFLEDHPDPERNVFVMMRFLQSAQLDEAHTAVKETLAARGFHAVRADDRDYTGELWSNIEVYLTGCKYGVAIFEDIEQREHNPNVALELGYMLGRRKRCLILKEKRLPTLPSDVMHRLYKPFDMFDVKASVTREVGRWIDVDLGLGA
ncbi:TIR domain-containing protein [Blastococcus litoris]|uniref:TIR domain-containing protein n=1 Tax=Blastococcus litoris TaxID=2171622 RepID=UPI0013DF51F0|nr:TIR domain-containing protein [Blastococcus litoris]